MVPGTLCRLSESPLIEYYFTSMNMDVPLENLPRMNVDEIYVYLGKSSKYEEYGLFLINNGTVWISHMDLLAEV